MSAKTTAAGTPVAKVVQLLVDVRASDTVYADLYLRRARELLGSVLTPSQYQVLKRVQRDIEVALQQSKVATLLQDWGRVEALAARVEDLRSSAHENALLRKLGTEVYETAAVCIDPFSPGFESLPGFDRDLAELREAVVDKLKALAAADARFGSFYDARRAFFSRLALASKHTEATAAARGRAELQQLAAQAAQRGDTSLLRRYAQELLALQGQRATAGAKPEQATAARRTTYQCPVDLSAPFPNEVAPRARALGLAVARTEPVPQTARLLDYLLARVWQPNLPGTETEREGTMRAEAVVDELGFPSELSGPVKVLVGQFLRSPFVNSGGARYMYPFTAEAALIEDFPEDQEPPASGALLDALGLSRRRALARLEIEDALLQNGATVLEERLLLDPKEFRLVCVPQELYMRFGRDRGWGQQQQWTHFDGYQVIKNGQLRALVGGDVRYGGLTDLVSIGTNDQRHSVIARFAVIRRARQVARWA